jgi:hypothetical protein
MVVRDVRICSADQTVLATIATWLKAAPLDALIAIDAPLGWPTTLGKSLATHRAGQVLRADPEMLFRRFTDHTVREALGIPPLAVGADLIARTAHSALRFLDELRRSLNATIPLAWSVPKRGLSVIEVYPAATLKAHGWPYRKYKRPEDVEARREIIRAVSRVIGIDKFKGVLEGNADALDAVVCLIAGHDFMSEHCEPPEDIRRSKREGWIWHYRPCPPSRKPQRGIRARRPTDPVEAARRDYLPSKLRVVLIGEAPPLDPTRFFYFANVQTHDSLFLSTMRAMYTDVRNSKVVPARLLRKHKREYLDAFRRDGFLLLDACNRPMPRTLHSPRKQVSLIKAGVAELRTRLTEIRTAGAPIILIKKTVYQALNRELRAAGFNVVNTEAIDFPGSGHAKQFHARFLRALRKSGWRPKPSGVLASMR